MTLLDDAKSALQRGDAERATALANKQLQQVLSQPERLLHLATAVHEIGMPEVAEHYFRKALRRSPGSDDLTFRWAVFRLVTGHPDETLTIVQQLNSAHDTPELKALEGLALRRLGRLDEAALSLQAALRIDPTRVEWWSHVGDLRMDQRRIEDAIRAYNAGLMAADRTPNSPPSRVAYLLTRLSDCFARSNLMDEAWRFSEAALALNPTDARGRWNDLHLLPIIYQDSAQIESVRARYEGRLRQLDGVLRPSTALESARAVAGMKLPFYLHYQGGDLCSTMSQYGDVVDRVVKEWQPTLAHPPLPPPPTDRIRVGFASYLLRQHTITKLFGSWIRDLDRNKFEVFAYHLGPTCDATTQALADTCATFRHLPAADAAAVCRQMRSDGLHAAIFPELGMAMTPFQVAALRTAPVQAVAWGHPVTTGLPAVDLFLSSEAMEAANGDDHYRERLVRLPGLGICPQPPRAPSERDRASFGVDDKDVLLLVPQSLFKLLPDEDERWADILERVPNSKLVLLSHHNPTVTGLFKARVQASFQARGIDSDTRLLLLPHLQWADYLALNRCADVFLDGLSWSGGMTTLEALAMGLVPVTCPGDVMRSRHTAAILTELGVTDTIGRDAAHRTELAVKVATDPIWRAQLQQQIAERLPALYSDRRGVNALEQTLTRAVGAVYQRNPTVTSGAT